MSICKCYRTRERLSRYINDTMNFKVIFVLNCESSKYIAKLFSLSIVLGAQKNQEKLFSIAHSYINLEA